MEKMKMSLLDNAESLSDILNGMSDWVRVIDINNNILFMNKSMSDSIGGYTPGSKCYNAIGRTASCEVCTLRKAIFEGSTFTKEELINDRVFSVMCSPVKDKHGEIVAAVEVLRDITIMKIMEKKIMDQNKKLSDDLNIAKKLQCSLLPKESPQDKYSFSFLYRPCESLGGDFVDIFSIDNNHTGIYIADVSGHGVPASMLTVFLRSTLDRSVLSPSRALAKLYEEFNRSTLDKELYITVFYAVIDFKNNNIVYANAGHNVCPVLYNSSSMHVLMSSGIPISSWIDTNPDYSDTVLPFKSNERLFMYTDGITEIKNRNNQEYGQDRLMKMLANNSSGLSGTLNNILDNIYKFAEINNPSDIIDDITMALLEFK